MDGNKKYFLLPGTIIGNKDLPGGKLECKEGKDPLEINKKHYPVIGKSIDYLVATGKAVDADGLPAMNKKDEPAGNKKDEPAGNKKDEPAGKSDARIALETEAEALEVEFNTKTSGKELQALIDAKKAEIEKGSD